MSDDDAGRERAAGHELEACFLVAAPSLACPFFNHTVVLLVDHREDGSLGFVINKPAQLSLDQLLDQIGLERGTAELARGPVMMGGPVAPETGWVVFDPSKRANGDTPEAPQASDDDKDDEDDEDEGSKANEGVLTLGDRLGVSANLEMLEGIARGEGPPSYLMMLGYAGWGPGQLDDEIREGAWIVVDLDPSLVFDTPVDERWTAALAKLGIDPALVASSFVADA